MAYRPPRKPLTTYGRRRARTPVPILDSPSQSISSPEVARGLVDTRPSQDSPEHTKRPLHADPQRGPFVPYEDEPDPQEGRRKRLKHRKDSYTDISRADPATSLGHTDYIVSLDAYTHTDSQYQTPAPTLGEKLMAKVSSPYPAYHHDNFSPVPPTGSTPHRTGSGTLKENSRERSSTRGLASPFNSRPSSAAASPRSPRKSARRSNSRNKIKKSHPPHHTKSLSNTFSQAQLEDLSGPSLGPSQASGTLGRSPHTLLRRSSGPIHISASFGFESFPMDWHVPPSIISRNTTPFSDGTPSTPFPLHFSPAGIFNGFPAAASTPARRPLANKTPDTNTGIIDPSRPAPFPDYLEGGQLTPGFLKSPPIQIFRDDEPTVEETPDDIIMQNPYNFDQDTAPVESHIHQRATIHVSSDSIFSSLDFSAFVHDTSFPPAQGSDDGSRTQTIDSTAKTSAITSAMDLTSIIHTPGSPLRPSASSMDTTSIFGSIHTQSDAAHLGAGAGSASISASSLLPPFDHSPSTPPSTTNKGHTPPESSTEPALGCDSGANQPTRPTQNSSRSPVNPSPSNLRPAPGSGQVVVPFSDSDRFPVSSDDDELQLIFSDLGLDEEKTQQEVLSLPVDGAVAENSVQGKRRTRAGTIRASDYMPRLPEIKDKGKGRTRAGTIRASDYGQGRPLPETSIPSPATSSSSLRAKPHSTASTSPGPFSLGEPFEPSIPTVMARPHQLPRRKTAVRAKRLGSPVHILKMTIGEPLSPQKDGESDDELLLIPRGWGYAHWDVSE